MIFEEALRNVAFALVRSGAFMANGFLFGLPLVLLLVLRPALVGQDESIAPARRRLSLRLEGLVQAALWASVTASALTIVLQAALISELRKGGFGSDSITAVFDSSFGRWYLLRLPLLAGLAVLLVGKVRNLSLAGAAGDETNPPGRVWWTAWIVLALGLLSTSSFSGHASVSTPLAAALLNDVVHLASGALWFSGIVVLAALIPQAWRTLEPDRRVPFLTPVVVRFSTVALVAIGGVALTGTFNSLFNVEALEDLIGSGYGRLLSVKILMFLGVVALGALNHFYVRKRLERAVAHASPSSIHRVFRKLVAVELFLALVIMGLTGLIAGSARTRPSASSVPGAFTSQY
jgi:putative copper export protein